MTVKILNYAVNGLGLGHITRLTAISRQIRRLALVAGIHTEITFLTSSENDDICYANGFASFKIPSKNSLAKAQLSPHRYRKIAKQWIWNAVNLISPDIFVVDTFPGGSFNELFDVLDFGQKNVFIYRAVKPEMALEEGFQSVLKGYHRIIKPNEHGVNDSPVPDFATERTVDVGEIFIRSRNEILSRSEARAVFDISGDAIAVYVSVGGGGDANAVQLLEVFRSLARKHPDVIFVFGAGSLYQGHEIHASNIRWTQRPMIMEYFHAFDAAITAGGFNTVNELMHCGIPCVFLPQERKYDDQFNRVHKYANQGAGIVANSLNIDELSKALLSVLDSKAEMSAVAKSLVPRNCAIDAAIEVLSTQVNRARLEHSRALLTEAAIHTMGFAPQEEYAYCELLHAVDSLAAIESSGISHDTDTVQKLTKEWYLFARGNNRTIRDVLNAVRMCRRNHNVILQQNIHTTMQEYIIQNPINPNNIRIPSP